MKSHLSTSMRPAARALAFAAVATLVGALPAAAADSYAFVGRLGLNGAAYDGPNGGGGNTLLRLNTAGFTIGSAERFVGADDVTLAGSAEQAVWLGSPEGATLRLGFFDALHTRDDGRQESYVHDLNTQGVTIGTSRRFDGHAFAGTSAWVEDRWGHIVKIGFYDAAHTQPDGSKVSRPVDLNAANRLVGYSEGTDPTARRSAWLATSTGAIQHIGLTDANHTDDDGAQWSTPVAINDAGVIVGVSRYYVETTPPEGPGPYVRTGDTPWVRRANGDMHKLGLYDAYSGGVSFLTESGYIGGWTRNPAEPFLTERATWVAHVDGQAHRVGIVDEFPYGDIYNLGESWIIDLNEAGMSAGESRQFPTRFDRGNTGTGTWIADAQGQTRLVGLYDSEHTTRTQNGLGDITDGDHQENHVVGLNENDAAIGYALRFDPTTNSTTSGQGGATAWVANFAGYTTRLGLTDAAHTRADGYRYSMPKGITPTKFVWGYSERYDGGSSVLGRTSWIYDRAAKTYTVIDFSDVAIADHWAADITGVDESTGRVFGNYHYGDPTGYHAFTYRLGEGATDLRTQVEPGFTDAGVHDFASAARVTPNGFIAGRAVLINTTVPGVYLVKRSDEGPP